MKPDAKGWLWYEKARMYVAWWALLWLDRLWFKPLCWLSGGRVWAHESDCWLTLASHCWLLDDLKRGELPEHQRIGGIWR